MPQRWMWQQSTLPANPLPPLPPPPGVVQYARSGRATCIGPCKRLIAKGDLRLGTPLQFGEGVSYKWRHW